MNDLTNQVRHIHLIGIGGIGVSGLAEIMLSRGYSVSGSDMKPSGITDKLQEKGARVYIGHEAGQVHGADLIVYTAAVREDNPELAEARRLGIRSVNRAEMLGFLMQQYAHSIAISGTHGKTTTTSMLSVILERSGLDPTLLIGGELKEFNGNAKIGNGPYLVAEACEYKDSFLSFHPFCAIILNIDEDHLDYFRDIHHIADSFNRFTAQTVPGGFHVINQDDPWCRKIPRQNAVQQLTFGIENDADCMAADITYSPLGCGRFQLIFAGKALGTIELSVPGQHNIYNALAAATTALHCGVSFDVIRNSLSEFGGAKRRFEYRGSFHGAKVIDDYAHHPTEVRATLAAASRVPHNRIWCIFQPHTYTRTSELMQEFARSFPDADNVIITRIYAARETDTLGVHGSQLADRIREAGQNALYLDSFEEITGFLNEHAEPNDLILTVGAGNVDEVAARLVGMKAN